MFHFLDKNRRVVSVVYFLTTVVIAATIALITDDRHTMVIAVFLIIASSITSLICFFSGIANAIHFLTYQLLILTGATLPANMQRFGVLSESISPDVRNGLSFLFIFVFAITLSLPGRIRRFVVGRLDNTLSDRSPADESGLTYSACQNSDDPDAPGSTSNTSGSSGDPSPSASNTPGTSYQSFVVYRSQENQINIRYSYTAASPEMKKLRKAALVLFIVLGLTGLLFAMNQENNTSLTPDQRIWLDLIGAISTLTFMTGLVIYVAGFARGLIVACALVVLGFIAFGVKDVLVLISEAYPVLLPFAIIALVLVIAAGLWELFMLILKSSRDTLNYFEIDELGYAIDFYLSNAFPILDFSNCTYIKIYLGGSFQMKQVIAFNANLHRFCSIRQILVAGAILNPTDQTYSVYLYTAPGKYDQSIGRFLKRALTYPFEITILQDAHWDIYRNDLLLNGEATIRLFNLNLIRRLTSQGIDLSQPQAVELAAEFANIDNTTVFMETIKQLHFDHLYLIEIPEKTADADADADADAAAADPNCSYQVLATKTLFIAESRLNQETIRFHNLAKQHNGEYTAIRLSPSGINTL